MATITSRISDLSRADCNDTPAVILAMDDRRVSLDLTEDEVGTLRDILALYFDKGTEVQEEKGKTFRAPTAEEANRKVAVRKWAKEVGPEYTWNGEQLGTVSEKGRLSEKVYRLYDAFQANSAKVDQEAAVKAENGNGVADPFTVTPKTVAKSKTTTK